MSKSKLVLGSVGAFLLGCVTSELAPYVVPPARAGTTPQRWEYICKPASLPDEITEIANAYGKAGWEMVGGAGQAGWMRWCFKRPLP
jgi:hypothetical protein